MKNAVITVILIATVVTVVRVSIVLAIAYVKDAGNATTMIFVVSCCFFVMETGTCVVVFGT